MFLSIVYRSEHFNHLEMYETMIHFQFIDPLTVYNLLFVHVYRVTRTIPLALHHLKNEHFNTQSFKTRLHIYRVAQKECNNFDC